MPQQHLFEKSNAKQNAKKREKEEENIVSAIISKQFVRKPINHSNFTMSFGWYADAIPDTVAGALMNDMMKNENERRRGKWNMKTKIEAKFLFRNVPVHCVYIYYDKKI